MMNLTFELRNYLSLKDTKAKIVFLDQSDFADFPQDVFVVAIPSGNNLPKLVIKPIYLFDPSSNENYYILPKIDFEQIRLSVQSSKVDGLVAYYVKKEDSYCVVFSTLSRIAEFDGHEIGPLIRICGYDLADGLGSLIDVEEDPCDCSNISQCTPFTGPRRVILDVIGGVRPIRPPSASYILI